MLACLTAILAILVVWRSPAHRPLAVAFTVAAVVDVGTEGVLHAQQIGRLGDAPAAYARMGLGLALPAVSAWAVAVTFGARLPWFAPAVGWATGAAAALWAPRWVWPGILPAARALAVVVEVGSWAAWRARGLTPSISHRVAALVVACDGVGLALEAALGREHLARWGLVAQAGAAATQALWLARLREK